MPEHTDISVVIPVLHEADTISALVRRLLETVRVQVIVVDGDPAGSTLAGLRDLERESTVIGLVAGPGRAAQMNAGAQAASGDAVLFLHADTRLPDAWDEAIRSVLDQGFARCGAFGLSFDDPGNFARMIATWATLRSRLDRRPYGDQAQFFATAFFRELGGYAEIPLMEDVEIMERACRAGFPPTILTDHVITSARRYRREGWLRRGVRNILLRLRYALGADPARLAGEYRPHGEERKTRRQCVVLFLKWPEAGQVKTRLAAKTGDRNALALARAMAEDMLETLEGGRAGRRGCDLVICFAPPERGQEMRDWLGAEHRYLPQQGADLGERMQQAMDALFAQGYAQVVLMGSDIPGMSHGDVDEAFRYLGNGTTCVLGPSPDGGYWLVGANRKANDAGFSEAIFRDMEWSGPQVFEETRSRLLRVGVKVETVAERSDVDTLADLERMLLEQAGLGRRTRALARSICEAVENQ